MPLPRHVLEEFAKDPMNLESVFDMVRAGIMTETYNLEGTTKDSDLFVRGSRDPAMRWFYVEAGMCSVARRHGFTSVLDPELVQADSERWQPLSDPAEVSAWLDKVGVKNYRINADGMVDVDGDVVLNELVRPRSRIPVKFGTVKGSFSCSSNRLVDLVNSPRVVTGDFFCDSSCLKSLYGAPTQVGGKFKCRHNFIRSLEGMPPKLGGSIELEANKITNLTGCPREVKGDCKFSMNPLQSLHGSPEVVQGDFVVIGCGLVELSGGPTTVTGDYTCQGNKLETLKGIPAEVEGLYCRANKLRTLEYGPRKVKRHLDCSSNQLRDFIGAPASAGTVDASGQEIEDLTGIPDADSYILGSDNESRMFSRVEMAEMLKEKSWGLDVDAEEGPADFSL